MQPAVARTIFPVLNLPARGRLMDPFAGSGTVLVEGGLSPNMRDFLLLVFSPQCPCFLVISATGVFTCGVGGGGLKDACEATNASESTCHLLLSSLRLTRPGRRQGTRSQIYSPPLTRSLKSPSNSILRCLLLLLSQVANVTYNRAISTCSPAL